MVTNLICSVVKGSFAGPRDNKKLANIKVTMEASTRLPHMKRCLLAVVQMRFASGKVMR
ncbi:protein of unknown function [Candidatus Filomicrobium marinum]|uniref:Uncharacterized protein n=1 Tax=Candidatus Filomicrobium marinum TaxID=1608628 RepID=A0A0D6JFM6_9HYPH|nr:protein of unknown function [Candidatus Filomicrobium marinum]CPR18746.1 protein of unknown function [Candidatus Filomicrobium marinum]